MPFLLRIPLVLLGLTVAVGAGKAISPRERVLLSAPPLRNSAQVQQFFNRLAVLPSPARQQLYANLINGLVADGIWTKLDALVIAAADNPTTALTNLVQASFAPTLVGSTTFTTDRGYSTSNPTSIYLSTNYNPSTAGGNFTQNSAMIAAWNITATTTNGSTLRSTAQSNVFIIPYSGGSTSTNLNATSGFSDSDAVADSSGLILLNRTSSANYTADRNGTQIGSHNKTSAAPENNTLNFMYAAQTTWTGAGYAIGSSLNSTQRASFYTRLQTYLHAIGAV
jgi:hypothetical protein